MKTVRVALGERGYDIHIGAHLLGRSEPILPWLRGKQVLLVSNSTVAPLYLEQAQRAFNGCRTATCVLPDGEQYKTLAGVNDIFTTLLENRFDRHCTLVALGGGVVGDMTGFAAACYQRGVDFIQMPTTLLAQVDSSVGGKTGVNHALGKNMIGAFWQPRGVLIDIATLDTLPEREFAAGLAEVVKYGLIRDLPFLEWLEKRMERLLARDPQSVTYAIERSCLNKAEIVVADETESGVRALLNLGHTFGHAIETGLGYGNWLHGEAVAVGMCMAARLSARLHWLAPADVARIESLLQRANLPIHAPELTPARWLELMSVDKKVSAGRVRLVLLQALGSAVVSGDYPAAALWATLQEHS